MRLPAATPRPISARAAGTFFECRQTAGVLGVVTWTRRKLAIAELAQFAPHRVLVERDAKRLPQPLRQIDQPPAHHAVHSRVRPRLHHGGKRPAPRVVQLKRRAGGLAVDQSRRTFNIEPHHPITDDLQSDATGTSSIAARTAIIDRRQRQKPKGLPGIAATPRLLAELIGGEVSTKRDRHGHGDPLTDRHGESHHAPRRESPNVSGTSPVGITLPRNANERVLKRDLRQRPV